MKTREIALAVALLTAATLASCKKDNGNDGKTVFKASIEKSAGNNTRTDLDPADGTVTWSAGDQILVSSNDGTSTAAVFTLANGEAGKDTDASFVGGDIDMTPNFTAIYPAFNEEGTPNTISGTTATFHIPQTQTLRPGTTDNFAPGSNPMMAYSTDEGLEFKNVFGGYGIPFSGDGALVTRIRLTSLWDDVLWGTCTVDLSGTDDDADLSINMWNENDNDDQHIVNLDCNVTLTAAPTYFYIMMPPCDPYFGFRVEAFNGDKLVGSHEFNADFSLDYTVERGVIYKITGGSVEVQKFDGVETISPYYITSNSALGIGQLYTGESTEYGVVYALQSDLGDPATDLVIDGLGVTKVVSNDHYQLPRYNVEMTGLIKDRIYYVRAYTVNTDGSVGYGDPIPFATRKDYVNDYNGMMPFQYTVSPTRKVNFSMGNLQWSANGTHATADGGTAPGTWRFAEYQFDYVGNSETGLVYTGGMFPSGNMGSRCNNELIDENYTGWIDLFGYGTSGWNSGANYYQPYCYSGTNDDYQPGGSSANNLTGDYANADWGVYNAISNGGNTPGQWRSLIYGSWSSDDEEDEWWQLIDTDAPQTIYDFAYSNLYVRMTAHTEGYYVQGLLVFPDGFSWPSLVPEQNIDGLNVYCGADYLDFQLNEAEWSLIEYLGVVFLPASGYRNGAGSGSVVDCPQQIRESWHYDSSGRYWSSTDAAFEIIDGGVDPVSWNYSKAQGCSVRLVRDAN